jgi:hypothetical protein
MEYALKVDTIKKELPSQSTFILALDRRTSPNKLAITMVSANYMDGI